MKIYFLFMISVFYFILSDDDYKISINNILTEKVASNGFLILDTSSFSLPGKINVQLNSFQLLIKNEKDNEESSLSCFIKYLGQTFDGFPKIACRTTGIKPGIYTLNPTSDLSFIYNNKYNITIPSFNIEDTFEIINGEELYFHDGTQYASFDFFGELAELDFELFEKVSDKNVIIYFDEIPIYCNTNETKLNCILSSLDFPQSQKKQKYNVYIKDSEGNKKRNYLIISVDIVMNYIK